MFIFMNNYVKVVNRGLHSVHYIGGHWGFAESGNWLLRVQKYGNQSWFLRNTDSVFIQEPCG